MPPNHILMHLGFARTDKGQLPLVSSSTGEGESLKLASEAVGNRICWISPAMLYRYFIRAVWLVKVLSKILSAFPVSKPSRRCSRCISSGGRWANSDKTFRSANST